MQTARLDESQAGIKIAGRNIKTSDMQMVPLKWQNEEKSEFLAEDERGALSS